MKAIIGDSWYASTFSEVCDSLDDKLSQKGGLVSKLASRPGLVRDLAMFWWSRKYPLIVISWGLRGRWMLIVLEGILNRRRIVILEFAPAAVFGSWTRRMLVRTRNGTIMKFFLRRALRLGHVLSEPEKEIYSKQFRLGSDQLFYLPWPQMKDPDRAPSLLNAPRDERLVVSSGRMFCDWNVILDASEGVDWELYVVCGRGDYKKLVKKSVRKNIKLLSEISLAEHQDLLSRAAVYVIALKEAFVSSGQVRVRNAIEAGVPIVATDVVGLRGYLKHRHSALLVQPGDSRAMRDAVNEVLCDPRAARKRAVAAWSDARLHTTSHYKACLREKILGCVV